MRGSASGPSLELTTAREVDPKGRDYANRKGEASRLVRAHRNNNRADKVSCVCFRVSSHAPLLSLVTNINRLP
jgi:hypothetical protein